MSVVSEPLAFAADAGLWGLNGRYGLAIPADPDLPDIFTAIQEQLGLKLESQRSPIEVIVVDAAAKPTDN
jgi:uncharacterized protein (TIGR03435 family)